MKKRFVLFTVCLCVLLSVFGTCINAFAYEQCNKTVIIGDVNLDGSIDSLDLSVLLREINAQDLFNNPLQGIAADVNYDAAVTMLDYDMLRDYLLGIRTSFPAGSSYTVYYGDVTGDQLVTLDDKTQVGNYILGSTSLSYRQYVAADVNGDMLVDSLDYALITQYLNNQITHFPICPNN